MKIESELFRLHCPVYRLHAHLNFFSFLHPKPLPAGKESR